MTQELRDLHERIGHEFEELERTVQLAESAWEGARRFPDQQEHFLNSLGPQSAQLLQRIGAHLRGHRPPA